MPANNTALLVMDMQNGIVERFADSTSVLEPFQAAISAARSADMPVIYVRVAFRDGFPEVSPNNKSFSALSQGVGFGQDDSATQVHESVAPQPGDLTVIKRRVSAFTGSDLEVILRGKQIDSLVLTGIATSGVVLSTLREAADRDFRLTVLSDACLDSDPEVHRVLTEKVFPRQADVLTVKEWAGQID
jgi:nicotinamidase-related amidase